ncbi:SRPBCC family protein [Caulobacter sp. S45]|uniref:SRPBCC family protein n=1 Tax=Caulobacter sp. S45 TaxID=1641861 RepID=UPI00131B7446|nr:SRPBCC family protein [Caulobacter sp. S45]
MKGFVALALGLALAGPCAAEVKSQNPQGFIVVDTAVVNVAPAKAYAGLNQIGRWWSGEHSLSGDAANLSLETHIGACLCEKLKDGGAVGWMLVVMSQPDHLLRLRGALGPLQGEGADGVMTWSFKPTAGGTEITLSYIVSGFARANAETFAAPVDAVLGEQLKRYKRYLETGAAAP